MSTGGNPLLEYLAKNEFLYVYKQTHEEQLQYFARYLNSAEDQHGLQKGLDEIVDKAVKVNSQISKVISNPFARQALMKLQRLGRHFHLSSEMKLSWFTKNMSAVSGGVSKSILTILLL
jgi:hypothetical protein